VRKRHETEDSSTLRISTTTLVGPTTPLWGRTLFSRPGTKRLYDLCVVRVWITASQTRVQVERRHELPHASSWQGLRRERHYLICACAFRLTDDYFRVLKSFVCKRVTRCVFAIFDGIVESLPQGRSPIRDATEDDRSSDLVWPLQHEMVAEPSAYVIHPACLLPRQQGLYLHHKQRVTSAAAAIFEICTNQHQAASC
jgi:hypothetical protein